jgi:hypothetical protein
MSKAKILSTFVEIEANRAKVESALIPDPELIAEGWERRFITDANRAPELIDLYQELGFEVRSVEVSPAEFNQACKDCGLTTLVPLFTIYTRKSD